jgi:hypothetical protein
VEIAHPYLLAAVVGGVLLYLVWQSGQAQVAQQAMVTQTNEGDTLFGAGGTGSLSGSSASVQNIVVTPNNLNQLSSS